MIKFTLISFLTLLIAVSISAETIRARVLWVQDGDTVIVTVPDGRWFRVRLWGIDAPESEQPGGKDAIRSLVDVESRSETIPNPAIVPI